jgi:hypothetical protein
VSKVTSEEVLACAKRMKLYGHDIAAKFLAAYAERIALDEAAVPGAWKWTQGARVFLTPYAPDRIPRLAVCHADTCIPLFDRPPAQPPIDLAAIREIAGKLRSASALLESECNDIGCDLLRAIGGTP